MPKAVIHQFEFVQIEKHHCHQPVVALGIEHRLLEAVFEQRAIRQPGQGVMVAHEANALFGQLAFYRNAGERCGHVDQFRLGRAGAAHGVGIQGKRTQDLSLMGQDRRRPAGAKPIGRNE
ncbi:hypothetical protein D3C78_1395460 [compost metagenome]